MPGDLPHPRDPDEVQAQEASAGDRRLEQVTDRLPPRMRATVRWLRRPSAFWIRVPAGVLLIGGGLLGFLPVLGVWMLPLGVALLAEDVPALRSLRSRTLDWLERRRPDWFAPT